MSSIDRLLIRSARILLPEGEFLVGDVQIREGKIVRIAGEITATEPTDTIIDATGLTLLPGVIDPQVHFREPGLEHKEDLFTASCACARGGVTSFLEMPNTKPLTITQEALDDKLQRAAEKSLVNYGFFIGATPENLPDLLTANPVCGIKIFMGSMQGPLRVSKVETSLPLMLTQAVKGRCSVAQVARWMSAAVAQGYNIPNKGAIALGYDADLVLVDLNTYRPVLREELLTKCGWSPFEGWNLTGWPVITIVGGQIVYERGKVNTKVRGKALSFE